MILYFFVYDCCLNYLSWKLQYRIRQIKWSENKIPGYKEAQQRKWNTSLITCLQKVFKMTTIHLLAILGPGQQAGKCRSKLDFWNCSSLIRNVLLRFLKTMWVVAIHLTLEDSPTKSNRTLNDQVSSEAS